LAESSHTVKFVLCAIAVDWQRWQWPDSYWRARRWMPIVYCRELLK